MFKKVVETIWLVIYLAFTLVNVLIMAVSGIAGFYFGFLKTGFGAGQEIQSDWSMRMIKKRKERLKDVQRKTEKRNIRKDSDDTQGHEPSGTAGR